jgi:hypothetical protein
MSNENHPTTQAERFETYLGALSLAISHSARHDKLCGYLTGLLLPGERKSVEPMAAQTEPAHVSRQHQALHHFVAKSDWSDEGLLEAAFDNAIGPMTSHGPVSYECKNPDAKRLGAWAVSETLCLLRWHHQVRDGTITLDGLQRRMWLLKGRYAKLLEMAKASRHKRTRKMGRELTAQWDALWTFASTPDVDPTNNHGERQIRPAVLHRKGSLGTWSDAGARFLERAMTVAATAKLQGVRLLDFLHAACNAAAHAASATVPVRRRKLTEAGTDAALA